MKRTTLGSITVALALTVAPRPLFAAPLTASDAGVVDVTVDGGLEDAELIDRWITDEAVKLLETRGIEPGASSRRLEVRVGGRDLDYTIDVAVLEGDEEVGEPVAPAHCKCSFKDLRAASLQAVESVLPRFDRQDTPPQPTAAPATAAPAATGHDDHRRGLGKAGRAGGALVALGASGTVAGIALLAVGVRYDADDDPGSRTRKDFRPAGGAVLALGLASVIAGAVALGIDRRSARRSSKLALVPAIGSKQAGFAVVGRF